MQVHVFGVCQLWWGNNIEELYSLPLVHVGLYISISTAQILDM